MYNPIHSLIPFASHLFFSNDAPKKHPFEGVFSMQGLTLLLTSRDCNFEQWLTWKEEIKDFIHKHQDDLLGLDNFLKSMTEWGIERNPQKTIHFLIDILSLDLLTKIVKFKKEKTEAPFNNIFEWAAEHAPFCPKIPHGNESQLLSEWRKFRPVVINFVPNLLNIFLGAFNFLDAHKKYTTLWDKHLILEIIYKFFLIPYCLVKILNPFFTMTTKVYLVSALIIAAVGIALSCYQRWLRPLSDEIVNCTNIDKQIEKGLIEPKVETKELQRLIAALEVDSNVLLIGNSGDGKTALWHHFTQKKHAGELPEKLQKLSVFEVDCGGIVSSYTYGVSEIINQMMDQIFGYHEEVLFVFDELFPILSNKDASKAFKKRFLEDRPHARFVASITFNEFEEIKKLDIDGSFRRRVVPILINSSNDDQIRLILRSIVNREALDIPIGDDAIEAILEISNLKEYLPGIGRPAKAIKILKDAISFCRCSYHPDYVSTELSKALEEYKGFGKPTNDSHSLKRIRDLRAQINVVKDKLMVNKQQALKIKKLMEEIQRMNANYYKYTHQLAQIAQQDDEQFNIEEHKKRNQPAIKKESIGRDVQIRYLWYYFYSIDAMKRKLQTEIDKVRPHMPVKVDRELVYEVYNDSKMIDKKIFDDMQDKAMGIGDDKIKIQVNDNIIDQVLIPDDIPIPQEIGENVILDDQKI